MFDDLLQKPKKLFDDLLAEPSAPKLPEFLEPLEVVILCCRTSCACGEVFEAPIGKLPYAKFPRRNGGSVMLPTEVGYPNLPHRVEWHELKVGCCHKCLGAQLHSGNLFPEPVEDPIARWKRMHETALPIDADLRHSIEARAARAEEFTSFEKFVFATYVRKRRHHE